VAGSRLATDWEVPRHKNASPTCRPLTARSGPGDEAMAIPDCALFKGISNFR